MLTHQWSDSKLVDCPLHSYDTQQYVLSGYNGRCAVIYGPTADIPTQPLEEDPLSVGGKLFYRLGDTGCTPGQSVTSTHCM